MHRPDIDEMRASCQGSKLTWDQLEPDIGHGHIMVTSGMVTSGMVTSGMVTSGTASGIAVKLPLAQSARSWLASSRTARMSASAISVPRRPRRCTRPRTRSPTGQAPCPARSGGLIPADFASAAVTGAKQPRASGLSAGRHGHTGPVEETAPTWLLGPPALQHVFQRLPGRDRGARRTEVDHVENDRFTTRGLPSQVHVDTGLHTVSTRSPHGLHPNWAY